MSGLGSFLAGMAQGAGTVMKFKQQMEDAEFQKGQRERTIRQQQREDSMQNDLQQAAAPEKVQTVTEQRPDTMDDRDVGQPGEQALKPVAYAVNGVKYGDQGAADKAASDYNAVPAATARQVGVLRRYGRLGEAQQVETGQIQSQAAADQLQRSREQAQREEGLRQWAAAVSSNDPSRIESFYNRQYNDGYTAKFTRNEDGSYNITRTGADGQPAGEATKVTRAGLLNSGLAHFDPKLFLTLDQAEQHEATRVKERGEDRTTRDDQFNRTMKLHEGQAAESVRHNQATEGIQREHVAATRAAQQARLQPAQPGLTTEMVRQFESDLQKHVGDRFDVKNATGPEDGAKISAAKNENAAAAVGVFRMNAEALGAGGVHTASEVQRALDLARDPKNVRVMKVGDVPYQGVLVGGKFVITSLPGQQAAPPRPAQTQGSVPNPFQSGVPRQPQATAPAVSGPPARYGLFSGPRLDYLTTQQQNGSITPAEAQELQQLQASKGGAWFRGRASEAFQE